MKFKTSRGTFLSRLGDTKQRGAQRRTARGSTTDLLLKAHSLSNDSAYERSVWCGFKGITTAPIVVRYVPPSRKVRLMTIADVDHIARRMGTRRSS